MSYISDWIAKLLQILSRFIVDHADRYCTFYWTFLCILVDHFGGLFFVWGVGVLQNSKYPPPPGYGFGYPNFVHTWGLHHIITGLMQWKALTYSINAQQRTVLGLYMLQRFCYQQNIKHCNVFKIMASNAPYLLSTLLYT